ncbi:hypothetical protein RND81_09G210800 [Saponaria officinalis]|uniref:Peptidase A1 domain-containing protein n=1 Tax=Saponaria officinalis TaxID=3572 RepID=A0AAW1IQQ0_SAPOF
MIHIDSPNSPLYQPNITDLERVKRWVAISDSRMRRFTKNATRMSQNLKPDESTPYMSYDRNGLFYVQLGLGKIDTVTSRGIDLLFDTSSDLSWTQCEDCTNCFPQNQPLFSPKSSLTYRPYPCNECLGGQCNQDHCMFEKSYKDGTHVRGILSTDKLFTISPLINYEEMFTIQHNTSFFCIGMVRNNIITGNLGMGNGRFSILSQLGSRANYQFSYCLQEYTDNSKSWYFLPMYLRFGDDVERLPNMVTTPLLSVNNHAYYYLVLNDISVNGINLNIPNHLFRANPDHSGGTIIDSGSTLSYLVPGAFNIVFEAISSYMNNNYPFLRITTITLPGVSACWESRISDTPYFEFPTLTFHLEDADLHVDPSDMELTFPYRGSVRYRNLYCLTVAKAEENGINMIGAYHQTNQRFIYNVGNAKLSFAKDNCATRG